MTNTAKNVLVPADDKTFRICFLYVGQGDATLLSIPSAEGRKWMLIDCNVDKKAEGIDLVPLLKDLLDDGLDAFVNTHPHKDHLCGLDCISEEIDIREVWHSGFEPKGDHVGTYEKLTDLIEKVGEENTTVLRGTRSEAEIGYVKYDILSPAEHVSDDIMSGTDDEVNKRIHEHCAVIRFKYGTNEKQVLITGDADWVAWKEHITEYHKERLPSTILSAVHHGSRTFFMEKEDDEPYLTHLDKMNSTYLVVSAPRQSESKHEHPHTVAMNLYKNYFEESNIFHLGENRECVIVDIQEDGAYSIKTDKELAKTYGFKEEKSTSNQNAPINPYTKTQLDRKPMGGQ
ncbi:ComEC/Rec2 family competence protein [Paenibacillus polymyxa]|uniref:ComEC/Rec2 family competence protein n=1 Tax=Paenibacillus polymyxa TaxID=1406 RepID=UPI0032179A8A